jgi:hypothetical protein
MGMIGELIQTIMEFVPAWLLALVLGIGAIAVCWKGPESDRPTVALGGSNPQGRNFGRAGPERAENARRAQQDR